MANPLNILTVATMMGAAIISAGCAHAQPKPSWRGAGMSYLQTCEDYDADTIKLCKLGQSKFLDNYRDSYLGRIEGWRNIAYFLTPDGEHAGKFGIRPNQIAACAWRMSILFSESDDIWTTDIFHANDQCNALAPTAFAKAIVQARAFVKSVHVVLEDDPKAPWNKDVATIPARCLDSRVETLSGPALPPFVPPAGCPKLPL